jgi:3-oxoadipate enol-lactonase
MAASVRLPGYAHAAAAMAETDLSDELRAIGVPALVLCGAADGITGPPESSRIADAIPDSVLVTIDGAGHSVNQERPGSFNAWVSAYIDIIEHLYH